MANGKITLSFKGCPCNYRNNVRSEDLYYSSNGSPFLIAFYQSPSATSALEHIKNAKPLAKARPGPESRSLYLCVLTRMSYHQHKLKHNNLHTMTTGSQPSSRPPITPPTTHQCDDDHHNDGDVDDK